MGLLKPIRDYLDTLVHPSAQHDPLTAARHRAFIAPRLIGSVVALAVFPVYIAMRGVPSMLEVLGVRLAGGADPVGLLPVAHRPV